MMNYSFIRAIGTANPPHRVSQNQIFEFMTQAHGLNESEKLRLWKLYEHSGIDFRHSVLEDYHQTMPPFKFFGNEAGFEPFPDTARRAAFFDRHAPGLCRDAVLNVVAKIPGFSLASITHLITVSCTGMQAPGIDISLVEDLGLSKSTERTCINFMGCYGAFNALKSADYICRANPEAVVLIVDIELCTLHFQKANTLDNWVANSLFSDGAAAVILEGGKGKKGDLKLSSFYSSLFLSGKEDMSWKIGNTGFEMSISNRVSKKIGSALPGILDELFERAKLKREDISYFAFHPGGKRILEVCAGELDICACKMKYSTETLRNFGNMSSASVLFVLELLSRDLLPENSGSHILGLAFGPGLTVESMVLSII